MRIILELFFVSQVAEGFHWVRREIDMSQEQQDPDVVATDYLTYFFADSRTITEKERYILHSTSWRYEKPRTICLTYIVFAETFSFAHLHPGLLKFSEIIVATTSNPKIPRPTLRLLPEQILSHGVRHLAFLISADRSGTFDTVIRPETKQKFVELHGTLAGRIS
jgi:hypothetical protein